MKQWHAYSICCQPEAAGVIVLGCDVKAVEGYVMVNFELATCSIFRDNQEKNRIPDADVGVVPVELKLCVVNRK